MRMLCEKLGSLKCHESTECNLEAIVRKVADAHYDTTNMGTWMPRSTVSSYAVICRDIDGALVEVSKRLKEAFDCEARTLKQSFCDALLAAVESTRVQFAGSLGALDKSMGMVIGRATGTA